MPLEALRWQVFRTSVAPHMASSVVSGMADWCTLAAALPGTFLLEAPDAGPSATIAVAG